MNISQEIRDGWCVVRPQGRADTLTADTLQAALIAAAAAHPRVALNLAELSYISSAGLRAVLLGARAAQQHGGEFVVCAATPGVREVFEISCMNRLMRVEDALPC